MKMMKKMGWNVGQPLGKMGTGVTEPIPMSVKVDRAGQSSLHIKCIGRLYVQYIGRHMYVHTLHWQTYSALVYSDMWGS